MSHEVLAPIDRRRAHRALSDQPIPRSDLTTLLHAAHLAPSCANNQPWRFIVVNAEPELSQLKEHLSAGNYWAEPSPCIIAITSKSDLDCQIPDGREYHAFGCGMAAMNLMLQATELGLIAHPIAGYRQAPIKPLLRVPEAYAVLALVVLGFPSDDHTLLSEKHRQDERSARQRDPLESVVGWNRFPLAESNPPS